MDGDYRQENGAAETIFSYNASNVTDFGTPTQIFEGQVPPINSFVGNGISPFHFIFPDDSFEQSNPLHILDEFNQSRWPQSMLRTGGAFFSTTSIAIDETDTIENDFPLPFF